MTPTLLLLSRRKFIVGALSMAALLFAAISPVLRAAEAPKVGAKAPDFALKALDGQAVKLSALAGKGPVVLVVLRGWPGYQCPLCDQQVHDFTGVAADFARARAQVLFVYPGPAEGLQAHAAEFKTFKGREWPQGFLYALDPDYSMVNAYGLRWDAPQETAFPSTFVLDRAGVVRFAKISHGHGDRTKAAEVLAEVKKLAK